MAALYILIGMAECIFCAIVAGSAPATIVYQDDDVVAFLDIRPISRGHTLVVPRRHATDLDELDPELGGKIFAVGHRIAVSLRRSPLATDGANLLINDGRAAFQTVGHVHLHVIPRHKGDLLRFGAGFVLRRPHDTAATSAAIIAGLDAHDAR